MTERMEALRTAMREHNLGAYIIPSGDNHLSEYICPSFKRREFVSGFSGSAGTAVVTLEEAALWTDGRYFLQAATQLFEGFILMKDGNADVPSINKWLKDKVTDDAKVGVDARVLSVSQAEKWGDGLSMEFMNSNLIDGIWTDRPPLPSEPVAVHPLKYAGESSECKIDQIRSNLKDKQASALVICALDEIAWLLNVRGNDIEFNPVVLSYVLLTLDSVTWYIDQSKVTTDVRDHVAHVSICDYDQVFADLRSLSESKEKIWLNPSTCTRALFECVPTSIQFHENSPIAIPKAIKNKVELQGLRASSIRDSVALVNYYSWLEKSVRNGEDLDEVSVADRLFAFRQEQDLFVSNSFTTISSSGANGAVIHYSPEKESCAKVVQSQMYLCDSGGQYLDGTTDVTRTWHFGEPTEFQKRCFTRVLQGHIDLAKATFPKGTTAHKLDVLARLPLWSDGLEYRHGTGHGYGAYLNVHEGPTLISYRESTRGVYFSNPLQPQMTVTIEPGYYHDAEFGIRIENCVIVVEKDTPNRFGDTPYYGFESLTLVPIQLTLIEASLLTLDQREWLNAYHKKVYETLFPLIEMEETKQWLKRATEAL